MVRYYWYNELTTRRFVVHINISKEYTTKETSFTSCKVHGCAETIYQTKLKPTEFF